jgi:hypothetical protein
MIRIYRGMMLVKSKEQPNWFEGKIQNECGEEEKVVYFVEVFLIVS